MENILGVWNFSPVIARDNYSCTLKLLSNVDAQIQTAHIIRSRIGRLFTRMGFNATWLREQRAALEAGVTKAQFRFHDLKIKATSDFDGDVQKFIEHKTRSMAERYNRTADKVVSLDRK
ncbi:hypothetical protein [Microbulbifer sp. JMSA003]|uniref:hypothetical protein n=1 Tax=Microbulbifer sp. JMSA003 TaxID=3243369 RepID=UPI00403A100B